MSPESRVYWQLDLELQRGSVYVKGKWIARNLGKSRFGPLRTPIFGMVHSFNIAGHATWIEMCIYDQIILDVAVAICTDPSHFFNQPTQKQFGLFSAASTVSWCQMGQKD